MGLLNAWLFDCFTTHARCAFSLCLWGRLAGILHHSSDGIDLRVGTFNVEHISTCELSIGDSLLVGWLPDRLCTAHYLGEGRFVAEECLNCKMQPGDRFLCHQFTLGKEAQLADFRRGGHESPEGQTYIIGTQHGLTTLKHLK